MRIAIGIYECFTSLDAMGPFQVLSSLPGAEVTFVAAKAGPVTDESGFLTVTARASFDELPDPDVLLVPGGITTGTLVPDHPIIGWIARAHPTTTWTTSVCSGALLLAAEIAGVEFARTLQLMMEYEPQPPFDAGSPAKAGPELVNRALTTMMQTMQQLAARRESFLEESDGRIAARRPG
jgi:putative intracellular protease/amidase